ncbi:MAG: hypothetical protein DMG97_35970 [Acidobacteria bacterium]|nr:MAG: hypothetical protein DMG97_35970 [Acidobacteriota bacterium]
MNLGFPVQELPVRSALTVAVSCVNRTRKHAASVRAYSVRPACPSIQGSTPKLHQQTTENVESEKGLEKRLTKPDSDCSESQNLRKIAYRGFLRSLNIAR